MTVFFVKVEADSPEDIYERRGLWDILDLREEEGDERPPISVALNPYPGGSMCSDCCDGLGRDETVYREWYHVEVNRSSFNLCAYHLHLRLCKGHVPH